MRKEKLLEILSRPYPQRVYSLKLSKQFSEEVFGHFTNHLFEEYRVFCNHENADRDNQTVIFTWELLSFRSNKKIRTGVYVAEDGLPTLDKNKAMKVNKNSLDVNRKLFELNETKFRICEELI